MTVTEWNKLLSSRREDRSFQEHLEIREDNIDELLN
jgi:hypothetical protein